MRVAEPLERRPTAPLSGAVVMAAAKRRRPSWVIGGVLLVGVAALLGAWVFSTATSRISVVVAGRDIAAGEVIAATDLRVVEMGKAGELRAIQPSQQQLIIGLAARGPLPEGTVLNTSLFVSRDRAIPAGHVVVGVSLEPGSAPTAGLSPGDRVDLIGVARTATSPVSGGVSAVVLATGTVWSVRPAGSSTSALWVSIVVPVAAETVVAQAAADKLLRLSLVGAG